MPDRYQSFATAPTSPASHAFAIAPSDGTDLAETTRALYVGGGGDIDVVLRSGAEVVFSGVAGGTLLPIQATRIKASGTTATAIVGLC